MINIEEEIKLLENAAENAVKEGEKEAVEKKRLDSENKRYTILRLGAQSSYVVKYFEGSNAVKTTSMGN